MTIKQNGATKAAPFHIDKKVIAHLIKNHQVDFFTHDAGEKGVNGHWKDKQEFPSVNQIIDNKNYHIRTGYGNNVDVDIDFLKKYKNQEQIFKLVNTFLPFTGITFGRNTTPHSHHLFNALQLPADFGRKFYTFNGTILEIRGHNHYSMCNGTYSEADGGRHSTGVVNGRTTYNYLSMLSDESVDPTDLADGAVGYLDRWAGQGNAAYEDAALYLIQTLESFGLEVITQRFVYDSLETGAQNPEAYNVCGYRWGEVDADKWMVFGAHFDIAPPVNAALLDPHIFGRTYGTRVGAYDNSAGTSMVLETAKMMSNYDSRRTMVFCFWSGEEGGKRGSDYWTEYYVADDHPEVTVTNYINLDMAGVNWPGGGGAPHGDPEPTPDEDGYPKDEEVWPMRVYIGPSNSYENFSQPGIVHLSEWIGSDALGLEEQIGTLKGEGFDENTWKYNSWVDSDRPEIIVYEDTTARSDHASFQDNLGTVTLGFGGLVDGYWCYHQTCDTLEEMEEWMDTTGKNYGEENTGVTNLCNSLDMITWWAVYSFFHLDEKPILNGQE